MASRSSTGGTPAWCHMFIFLAGLLHLASPAYAAAPANPCKVTWAGASVTGQLTNGACRTTVRYGAAERWADSVAATSQTGFAPTSLPPACPQQEPSELSSTPENEDCLFATIYAPATGTNLPIFVWLHGGSFVVGSASSPGLDGSALAKASNIVVVVLQYRLGSLGLLPPASAPSSADPNLALRDVILGLKEIKTNAVGFRGDGGRITLGGQSSGAGLIRALWAAPAASGTFHRMIMQSDPLTYGMAPAATTAALQASMYSNPVFASATSLADLRAVPVADIMAAQRQLWGAAPQSIPGVPLSEPLRPTFGTATLPHEPTSALFGAGGLLALSPSAVPLLLTTVLHEAAPLVGEKFPMALPASNSTYIAILASLLGPARASAIVASPAYTLISGADTLRAVLTRVFTDGGWTCATREAAKRYAAAGGKVYLGEFVQGQTYTSNAGTAYCAGRVCHQDDIFPVFNQAGTSGLCAARGRSRQVKPVLSAWTAFIKTGNPGNGWAAFPATGGVSGAGVKALGSGGTIAACPANFWGNTVQWDWQLFNY